MRTFATQMCVTVGRLDLEDARGHLEDGNVKGAAAKIVDGDNAVVRLF
jgi:hypothetical protein